MKALKLLFAGVAAALLVSSCGLMSGIGRATQPATNTDAGINAGTALAAIFGQYKKDGRKLDLGNLSNIINIATIANNLGLFKTSLTDEASSAFTQGLIQGSKNLVNQSNASAVLTGLQTLAKTNLNQFTKAATQAEAATTKAVGTATAAANQTAAAASAQVDATSAQVMSAVSALTSILGQLK